MTIRIFLAILFAAISSDGLAQAEKAPERAAVVMDIFSRTCLAADLDAGKLRKMLAPGGPMALPKLEPEVSRHFLADRAGTVWFVPSRTLGDTVISMMDAGACTVVVRRWPETDFEQKLKDFFARDDSRTLRETGRDTDTMENVRFDLVPAGRETQPVRQIVLSTSASPETNFQFFLSLGRK